jgi:hypothetical protein
MSARIIMSFDSDNFIRKHVYSKHDRVIVRDSLKGNSSYRQGDPYALPGIVSFRKLM